MRRTTPPSRPKHAFGRALFLLALLLPTPALADTLIDVVLKGWTASS